MLNDCVRLVMTSNRRVCFFSIFACDHSVDVSFDQGSQRLYHFAVSNLPFLQ